MMYDYDPELNPDGYDCLTEDYLQDMESEGDN